MSRALTAARRLVRLNHPSLGFSCGTRVLVAPSACSPAQLVARWYHENVVDHYENPRNVGSLPKDKDNVGTGLVGAPACGDVMKLQIEIEGDKIKQAKFKTFGCGSAIASSSYATTWLEGRSVDEAMSIKNTDIASHLKLPPVKLHCSMLAEDAVKAAIKDYREKQAKKKQSQAAS